MNDPTTESADLAPQPPKAKFNFWRWFWLSTLVGSIWLVWYDFYAPSSKVTWAKDYASAQQMATQSHKPILVFFTGKWCVPCRIMKRNVLADQDVEAAINTRFAAVMIDVDDPKAKTVVGQYKVGPTPTTVITDPAGRVLQYFGGGLGKKEFLELLAKPNVFGTPSS